MYANENNRSRITSDIISYENKWAVYKCLYEYTLDWQNKLPGHTIEAKHISRMSQKNKCLDRIDKEEYILG